MIDINSIAAKNFYKEIRKFALNTKPWDIAVRHEVRPDEINNAMLISMRVYGRNDEFIAVIAAAGLNTTDDEFEYGIITLPNNEQLNRIKFKVGFESIGENRDSFKPNWKD